MALEGTGVRVDVRPVSSMLPHEETIPSHVERIATEITQERIQRDPIIVDAESGAVLDGMHRLAAFLRLGLEAAVCCPVDYSSKAVNLHRWARAYSHAGRGDLDRALIDAGISRRSTLSEAFASLEARRCGLAALGSQGVFLPASPSTCRAPWLSCEGWTRSRRSRGGRGNSSLKTISIPPSRTKGR